MHRLFVAIKVPESVQNLLQVYQPESTIFARILPPEQLHITLHFIGNVEDKTFQLIDSALTQINALPFLQHLSTIGAFFRKKSSDILWAGVEKNNNLLALHQSIGETLLSCDVTLDKREYSPHITLAKIQGDSGIIRFAQAKGINLETNFKVRGFSLFESRLTDVGVVYKEIKFYRF